MGGGDRDGMTVGDFCGGDKGNGDKGGMAVEMVVVM